MKIETLDYIVMTARFPTISIAAEKQFLSQTTLSSAIKSVENEVGFPIFERTPRGIALTAQGVNIFNGNSNEDSITRMNLCNVILKR